jgi:hypothetical protein
MSADGETDSNGDLAVVKCTSKRASISGTGLPRSPGFCTTTVRSCHLTRLDQPKISDRDGSIQTAGKRGDPDLEFQARFLVHFTTASSPLLSVSPSADIGESYSASNPGSKWN